MERRRLFEDKPPGDLRQRGHQGIHGLNVVLYQPEIPQNTGSIARLCVGADAVLHLVHPLGFRTDEAALKRAGLDYWENLTLYEHAHWQAFLDAFPAASQRMWLLSSKVERPYATAPFMPGDFLVFGPETRGLPADLLLQHRDNCLTIPTLGPVRSFNLSNAVAIVLYEAIRQVQKEAFTWKS